MTRSVVAGSTRARCKWSSGTAYVQTRWRDEEEKKKKKKKKKKRQVQQHRTETRQHTGRAS